MKEITVIVDHNDGDYNTEISRITDGELEEIMPLLEAIKNFKPYAATVNDMVWNHDNNYPYGESCRTDLGQLTPEECYGLPQEMYDIFEEHCPYCGDYGFHTVESVEVSEIIVRERLV